jgi:hypothetical protein
LYDGLIQSGLLLRWCSRTCRSERAGQEAWATSRSQHLVEGRDGLRGSWRRAAAGGPGPMPQRQVVRRCAWWSGGKSESAGVRSSQAIAQICRGKLRGRDITRPKPAGLRTHPTARYRAESRRKDIRRRVPRNIGNARNERVGGRTIACARAQERADLRISGWTEAGPGWLLGLVPNEDVTVAKWWRVDVFTTRLPTLIECYYIVTLPCSVTRS